MANNTYKEFGKYLRAVANEFSKYGDEPLEEDLEFDKLYTTLCQMHNDYKRGAERIEALKRTFVTQCEDYGQGWTPITNIKKETEEDNEIR